MLRLQSAFDDFLDTRKRNVILAGLHPRRLTVVLSRAKRKMILAVSRSIFQLFLTDEEQFANRQLWKNLL